MLHQRSLCLLLIAGLLAGGVLPTSAQSVSTIVDEMRTRHEKQLETVDTYIVETNLYTSYHKKTTENGETTYKSQTEMKEGSKGALASGTTPSSVYGIQLDRLEKHATYSGTETVNERKAHVLTVDDPSKVNVDIKQGDAESLIYYIDTEEYVPTRLLLNTKGGGQGGASTSSITVNMKNFQTVEGLTLPYRMEFHFNMDISEEKKKKMAAMIQKLEKTQKGNTGMGQGQIDMMKRMLSGDPILVEVKNVQVNTEIPAGVF